MDGDANAEETTPRAVRHSREPAANQARPGRRAAYFKAERVTVEQAFQAYDKREGWEAGEAEPTDREWAIAHIWEEPSPRP